MLVSQVVLDGGGPAWTRHCTSFPGLSFYHLQVHPSLLGFGPVVAKPHRHDAADPGFPSRFPAPPPLDPVDRCYCVVDRRRRRVDTGPVNVICHVDLQIVTSLPGCLSVGYLHQPALKLASRK